MRPTAQSTSARDLLQSCRDIMQLFNCCGMRLPACWLVPERLVDSNGWLVDSHKALQRTVLDAKTVTSLLQLARDSHDAFLPYYVHQHRAKNVGVG